MILPGPALALLELDSIARGILVGDAVVKRAAVSIAQAEPVSPGKYVLLFTGGLAETEESFQAGVEASGASLLDKLFLPQAASVLLDALRGNLDQTWGQSFGMVETHSVASALLAADTALKRADVRLRRLHLARGIGGKGYFVLSGSLPSIEVALLAAASSIEPHLLVTTELIQSPHSDLEGPVL